MLSQAGDKLIQSIWPRSFAFWMAAVYLSLFIIRPWEVLAPWLATIRFERVFALVMIGVVLLSQKARLRMTIHSVVVLFLLASILISALVAEFPTLAWDTFYRYITIVIFYFVLVMVIRSPYQLVFMVTVYIATMTLYLAKAQWEFFIHGRNMYRMEVVRLVGIENTFGGPNDLAMSIVVSLPMLWFLWSVRKTFTDGWPKIARKWFPRSLAIYSLFAVSSIVLTNSRSGMLSFILFLSIIIFQTRKFGRKLGYTLLGVVALLMIWQFMPDDSRDRFRTIWQPEAGPVDAQASAQGRIAGLYAGLEMFKRFPIAGVGPGNFVPYRVRYVDGVHLEAHNFPGQVLGESGLLGGAAFGFLILVTFATCRRIRSLASDGTDVTLRVLFTFALACRAALMLLLFEGLFAHNAMRYNWLWVLAFGALALEFTRNRLIELQTEKIS